MSQTKTIELSVGRLASGPLRLDAYLTEQLPDFSRTRLQALIGQSQVIVNGKTARPSRKLKGGEHIVVTVPPPKTLAIEPERIQLSILYEDRYLLVVNKPWGMVTHPGAGVVTGTLVNALLSHCGSSLSGIGGALRPGIVHRLDKDTSGLLVVAKEERSHRHLSEQIRARTVTRKYTALVAGILAAESGTIDRPVGRHPRKRKQMAITVAGRSAVTHFLVLQRLAHYTLVSLRLATGRTHQIRVHMASIGHPVVGDLVYNQLSSGTEAARAAFGIGGHLLHSCELSFRHPVGGRLLKFEAPLPDSFSRLIESLAGIADRRDPW